MSRAVYDEDEEDWKLRPYQAPSAKYYVYHAYTFSTTIILYHSNGVVEARPMSSKSSIHPVTTYGKLGAQRGDPRYMVSGASGPPPLTRFSLFLIMPGGEYPEG